MATANISEIKTYLNYLNNNNEEEIFTFAFFDKASTRPLPKLHTVFATPSQIEERVRGLSNYTLHVCLNRTSDKGRKDKDVQGVRVFCLDLDTPHEPSWIKQFISEYNVGMVVQSSPDKYHCYWRVGAGVTMEAWKNIQIGIAHLFGGDSGLSSLGHTIRVPGVERVLKDGETVYTPHIVWLAESDADIGMHTVASVFSGIWEAMEEAKIARKILSAKERKVFESLIGEKVDKLEGEHVKEIAQSIGRNKTLYNLSYKYLEKFPACTLEEVGNYALAINNSFDMCLEDFEFEKVVSSAWSRKPSVKGEENKLLEGEVLEGEIVGLRDITDTRKGNSVFAYDYSVEHLFTNRFTDLSILERIYQRFGHRLVRTDRGLMAFNLTSKLWVPQDLNGMGELFFFFTQCVQDVLRDPRFEIELCVDKKGEPSMSKKRAAQERFMNVKLFNGIARALLSTTDPRVVFKYRSEFDAQNSVIFVANGCLNMLTEELRDAEPSDFLMTQAPVKWDSGAECPGWITFLGEVFAEADDPESMITFMQQLFGYSLSGSIKEQKIFCHFGTGANGKSKVLSALRKLGGDLATFVDPDDFSKIQGGFSRSFERFGAKAEGKRCVIVDDLETASIWNESLVKAITATHYRARGEYEKSREVLNKGKVHLGLNVAPSPQAENYGILRRLCLIPYGRQFAPSPAISTKIDTIIEGELSGILRWACEGLQNYVKNGGLAYPTETEVAIEEYREDHFVIERLLRGAFEPSEEDFIFSQHILPEFMKYALSEGEVRKFTQDEVLSGIRNVFKIASTKKYDPEKKFNSRGYKIKSKFVEGTDSLLK